MKSQMAGVAYDMGDNQEFAMSRYGDARSRSSAVARSTIFPQLEQQVGYSRQIVK